MTSDDLPTAEDTLEVTHSEQASPVDAAPEDTASEEPSILEPVPPPEPVPPLEAAATEQPFVPPPDEPEPDADASEDNLVRFRSSMPELNQFDVMDVYPSRDATGRYLIWAMDAETAERFARHYFVTSGRIVQA